jgi:hypothetical protein
MLPPYATFSSVITATTVAAFFLIIRNLETDIKKENLKGEVMNSTILEELAMGGADEESNEVDFESLESQFVALEAEEMAKEAAEESRESEQVSRESEQVSREPIDNKDEPIASDAEISNSEPLADLTIEVSHKLSNSGQHRPYTLSIHFTPRPRGDGPIPWSECKLNLEWPLPKNVLVDVWSLRRLSPFTVENDSGHVLNPSSVSADLPFWSVKPRHPDIEVGAYDPKARPFILTAQVPFKVDGEGSRIENGKLVQIDAPWNLDLHVPDLLVRYQAARPGHLFQKHSSKSFYIPTPNLQLTCPEELQIDWQMSRLRPLKISLPIGSATPIVSHVTVVSVLLSSIFLLVTLFKF